MNRETKIGIALVAAGAAFLFWLRKPRGGTVADVAAEAARLWSGLTESMPRALPIIKDYWSATGLPFPGVAEPWSAAFVSWAVQQSDTPNALEPAGAHIFYARQAYLDRGVSGRYGAFRPGEVQVAPGDILIRGRGGVTASFSDLQRGGDYKPTHGDIVTAVLPGEIRVVGGNLDNSVKEKYVRHSGGVITDPAVVAVLKIQA